MGPGAGDCKQVEKKNQNVKSQDQSSYLTTTTQPKAPIPSAMVERLLKNFEERFFSFKATISPIKSLVGLTSSCKTASDGFLDCDCKTWETN